MALKQSATRDKHKTKAFLVTRSPTWLKLDSFYFLASKAGQKEDKNKFATKFAVVTITFI